MDVAWSAPQAHPAGAASSQVPGRPVLRTHLCLSVPASPWAAPGSAGVPQWPARPTSLEGIPSPGWHGALPKGLLPRTLGTAQSVPHAPPAATPGKLWPSGLGLLCQGRPVRTSDPSRALCCKLPRSLGSAQGRRVHGDSLAAGQGWGAVWGHGCPSQQSQQTQQGLSAGVSVRSPCLGPVCCVGCDLCPPGAGVWQRPDP